MKRGLLTLALALVLVAPAHAGGPEMRIGAAEDFVKQPDVTSAKAKLTLMRLAGFDTVRVTVLWALGTDAPPAAETAQLRALASAAKLTGMRVIVSVYPFGSSQTPLTAEARARFAAFTADLAQTHPDFREVIVGNEPNINRFWLPQFGEDGSNAAAPAFLSLLAETYDALKAVSPEIVVWGAGLSPRGSDNPALSRHTHSPTQFLVDLGAAYRASGRTLPMMDGLAIHPYGDDSSQAPRDSAHPNSRYVGLADYGKLVGILAQAFDGTAQAGATLPILYDEFGIESQIPTAKEALYTGTEPQTTKPVPEETQGTYYREAIAMAFCQPNVRGLLLFHAADEVARLSWQSGVYYADETPKASLRAVRDGAAEARRGVIARCAGLQLVPKASVRRVADPGAVAAELRCDLDCTYTARLVRLRSGKVARAAKGSATGGTPRRIRMAFPRPRAGRYRFELDVLAAVNTGERRALRSGAFTLR